MEAGTSLADIAKAQGKTVSGLEDAIVAAATAKLDAAVTAGKLTAAQEATMLADLKSHVDDMVTRTGPPAGGRPRRPRPRPRRPPLRRRARRERHRAGATTNRTFCASPSRGAGAGRRPAPVAPSAERHRFATVPAFGYLRCQRRSRCSSRLSALTPKALQGSCGAGSHFGIRRATRLVAFSSATSEGATRSAHRPSHP